MRLYLAFTLMTIVYYFEFEPLPEDYELKINPFPALTVSKKLEIRIAKQRHELTL